MTEAVASVREPQIASGFPTVFPSSPKQGNNIRMECFAWGTGTAVLVNHGDKVFSGYNCAWLCFAAWKKAYAPKFPIFSFSFN